MDSEYGSGLMSPTPFWEQDSFLVKLQHIFPHINTPDDSKPAPPHPDTTPYDKKTLCYRRLWLAVFDQAMEDLCCPKSTVHISQVDTPGQKRDRKFHLRKETEKWMRDEQSHGVGSFRYICDVLDLDQQVMIERIFDGPGTVKPHIVEYFRTNDRKRRSKGRYVESKQMNKPHPKRTKKEIEDAKRAQESDQDNPGDDIGGNVRACAVA